MLTFFRKDPVSASPIQRTKLPEEAAARLLGAIRAGEYAPGERLPPERALALDFGISRASLRGALNRLELLGYLEVRHGGGTFVRLPDALTLCAPFEGLLSGLPRSAHDLLEFRRVLEPEVAALAARRATPDRVLALRAGLKRQESAAQAGLRLGAEDTQFHQLIAEIASNTVILRVLETLRALLRDLRDTTLSGDRPRLTLSEHARIVEAIAAGDAPAAREAMASHITSVIHTAEKPPKAMFRNEGVLL